MVQGKFKNGKDRETTENNLLKAVGELVAEEGFENLGVNAIATRAGVSKMLIYRYFGSIEGLITSYIQRHDFWINFNLELPYTGQLGDFLKNILHQQIRLLRNDNTLKRLYRWELSCNNPIVEKIRRDRENKGLQITEQISKLTNRPMPETAAICTLLSTSISYLALLEENCPAYNGISLQTDEGWQQIEACIDQTIDYWLNK